MKKEIRSNSAPAPIGPYSQAVQVGNMLFVSGMIGLDVSGLLKEDIISQTTQIFENLKNILEEAGFSVNDIVKTTIYLTHLENFAMVNSLYEKFFENIPIKPARSTVEVSSLPKGALIEIDAVAISS